MSNWAKRQLNLDVIPETKAPETPPVTNVETENKDLAENCQAMKDISLEMTP